MPVEIKELVIRISTTSSSETVRGDEAPAPLPADQAALVEACVKQVLKILEKKKKR